MKKDLEVIKKSVVFLGVWKIRNENGQEIKEPDFWGTGVLAVILGKAYLLTAKHVVYDMEKDTPDDDEMHVFFNMKDGTLGSRLLKDIKSKLNVDWFFHDNKKVDIAILPYMYIRETEVCSFIELDPTQKVENLHELIDVFFLSYQPGLESSKINPIFRNGTISLINDDSTFYIDGTAFEGNSGSPVFTQWVPVPGDVMPESRVIDRKFIGILVSYLPQAIEATRKEANKKLVRKKPRKKLIFQENTGLSEVWSLKCIEEIIRSQPFQDQLTS